MTKKRAYVKMGYDGRYLYADIYGELDHHGVKEVREVIDEQLYQFRPTMFVMNFGQVAFMDSSGLGLVVGRAKVAEDLHCMVRVVNVSPRIMKIFALAGLERLSCIKIEGA